MSAASQSGGMTQHAHTPRQLTKPQVAMLTRAMRLDVAFASRQKWKTAHHLNARGFATIDDNAVRITHAGLRALRDYRAIRYANYGCIAYLHDLEEVDAFIAKAGDVA